MASATWRRVAFFADERGAEGSRALPQEVTGVEEDGGGSSSGGAASAVVAATSGRGHVFLANDAGVVSVLGAALKLKTSWRAHTGRVMHMRQLQMRNVLLTVGEDENVTSNGGARATVMHVWDMEGIVTSNANATTASENGVSSRAGAAAAATAALGGISAATGRNSNGVSSSDDDVQRASPTCIRTTKLSSPKAGGTTAAGGGAGIGLGGDTSTSSGGGGSSSSMLAITTFDVCEESSSQLLIALGLSNGSVFFLRGDVVRDRTKHSRISLAGSGTGGATTTGSATSETGFEGGVTGLHIRNSTAAGSTAPGDGNAGNAGAATTVHKVVYAITREGVYTMLMPRVGVAPSGIKVNRLDMDIGAGLRCSTVNTRNELLIARPEAVYCFTDYDGLGLGRGPCFAFDGEKRLIVSLAKASSSYLVVISRGGTGSGAMGGGDDLIIYDLRNKVIAYRRSVGEVDHVLYEWGLVVVVTPTNIFCLRERNSSERLDLLFKKGLYNIAISIAAADKGDVAEVQRRYGDHLYQKKDYDGAMSHYCMTIGSLEPSYVIRKYLDSQRIQSLTSYLELLHEKGLASADHTTLLLNCYTKSKDVKKLDAFLSIDRTKVGKAHDGSATDDAELANGANGHGKSSGPTTPQFDVETAIRVLRSAEYFDHALAVAARAGEHELYVAILLEDLQRFPEALEYVRSLPPLKAAAELRRYGKALVTALPDDTTSLLMYLCTLDTSEQQQEQQHGYEDATTVGGAGPDESSSGGRPRAVEFIHCFVERQVSLMVFLEFIVNSIELTDRDSATVYDTLLDLYLSSGGDDTRELESESAREVRCEKALGLLRQGWESDERQLYNADQALLLCQMRGFRPGLFFLYEKMGMHAQMLQMYKEDGDHAALLDAVIRVDSVAGDGGRSAQLWIDVLEYFASRTAGSGDDSGSSNGSGSNGDTDGSCEAHLRMAISHIEAGNILPPLVVLQVLSKSSHITVGAVKSYIARALEQQTRAIDDDYTAIRRYRDETEKMCAEVDEMSSRARVFQLNKCSICSTPLDLPAVHFYCMHSFHQRCLGDNEHECPICANKQRQVATIKANLAASVRSHDKFYQQLKNSTDGFDVVAEFFSRGLFNGETKAKAPTTKL